MDALFTPRAILAIVALCLVVFGITFLTQYLGTGNQEKIVEPPGVRKEQLMVPSWYKLGAEIIGNKEKLQGVPVSVRTKLVKLENTPFELLAPFEKAVEDVLTPEEWAAHKAAIVRDATVEGNISIRDRKYGFIPLEMSWDKPGNYSFLFMNPQDRSVSLMAKKGCTCTKVEMCLVDESWVGEGGQTLQDRVAHSELPWKQLIWDEKATKDESIHGLEVPAKSVGLIRLHWNPVPKPVGQQILEKSFHAYLWTEMGKEPGKEMNLEAKVIYTDPLHVQILPKDYPINQIGNPDRTDSPPPYQAEYRFAKKLGIEDTAEVDVLLWSSLVEKFDWQKEVKPDLTSNVEWKEARALTAEERKFLMYQYRRHVLSGWRVRASLRSLPYGPFTRQVKLSAEVGDVQMLTFRGEVAGIVNVLGNGEEVRGRIQLGPFPYKDGCRLKTFELEPQKAGLKLSLAKVSAPYLKVQPLRENKREDGVVKSWSLMIEIPPQAPGLVGVFGEDSFSGESAIYISVEEPDKAPRQLRIPVSGQATSN